MKKAKKIMEKQACILTLVDIIILVCETFLNDIFTEGKKQYSREFLILLATGPMSMRKPENLPSMDIIKDAPNHQDKNQCNFDRFKS